MYEACLDTPGITGKKLHVWSCVQQTGINNDHKFILALHCAMHAVHSKHADRLCTYWVELYSPRDGNALTLMVPASTQGT